VRAASIRCDRNGDIRIGYHNDPERLNSP